MVWEIFFATPNLPDSIVALSGRIEGDDSAVAPKTSGKILEVTVREGDTVTAGQVIARLDDAQVRAREDQARAALADAQAKAQAARDQIAVLQEQLRQNQLQTGQSTMDAEGRVRQAQADLTAAEADLAQQQAALRLAEFNRDAYTRLAKTGAASQQQGLQAEVQADQQAAAVAAAQRKVESSRGALTTAQANLDNPENPRSRRLPAPKRRLPQQQSTIAATKAETAQAQAQLAQAEADRADLTVLAPFSGTVITRAAEPGEVVQAGTAIVTLLDLSKVYLRGFIPEGEIGKVKVGQPAHIFLDSNPNQAAGRLCSAYRPAGDLHSRKHLLSRRSREAGGGRQGAIDAGDRLRKAGHAGGRRNPDERHTWPPHKRAAQ